MDGIPVLRNVRSEFLFRAAFFEPRFADECAVRVDSDRVESYFFVFVERAWNSIFTANNVVNGGLPPVYPHIDIDPLLVLDRSVLHFGDGVVCAWSGGLPRISASSSGQYRGSGGAVQRGSEISLFLFLAGFGHVFLASVEGAERGPAFVFG